MKVRQNWSICYNTKGHVLNQWEKKEKKVKGSCCNIIKFKGLNAFYSINCQYIYFGEKTFMVLKLGSDRVLKSG